MPVKKKFLFLFSCTKNKQGILLEITRSLTLKDSNFHGNTISPNYSRSNFKSLNLKPMISTLHTTLCPRFTILPLTSILNQVHNLPMPLGVLERSLRPSIQRSASQLPQSPTYAASIKHF